MKADICNNFWLPDILHGTCLNGKIATVGFHDNSSMNMGGDGKLCNLISFINSYELYYVPNYVLTMDIYLVSNYIIV